jgi:hypothetical protein
VKKIAVLILVAMIAVLSIASNPLPGPIPPAYQFISGTLGYSRNNVCMISDIVALPVMDNVYLVGKGFPTHGQFRGCHIYAEGTYISLETCKVFQVARARISCGQTTSINWTSTPDH